MLSSTVKCRFFSTQNSVASVDTVINFTPIVEVNFEWDVAVVDGSSNTKHASQDSVMSASSSSFVMLSNLLYVILQCVLWHIELRYSFPPSSVIAASNKVKEDSRRMFVGSTVICSRGMVKSHLYVEFRGSIQRVGSLKINSLIDFVFAVQAGRFETR
jgi:hypothetical protein